MLLRKSFFCIFLAALVVAGCAHKKRVRLPTPSAPNAAAQSAQPRREPDVPFVPTTDEAVLAMLKLADVKSTDTVYDLGCGDGRIVIAAAKNFGAHAVGIEIQSGADCRGEGKREEGRRRELGPIRGKRSV